MAEKHRLTEYFLTVGLEKKLTIGLVADLQNRLGGEHRLGPGNKFTVAVLANDVGVDVPWINRKMISQQVAKPGGIKGRAASEHPAGVEAGKRTGNPGHDINRVGRHQKNPVKARFSHRSDDGAEYSGIPL